MAETQFAVRWTENGAPKPTLTVAGSRENAEDFVRFLRGREELYGLDHQITLLYREIPDWKVRTTA